MNYQDAIDHVANKLELPREVVKEAYESYWKYIRCTISELPLKDDLSEEEFNKLRTNFNIPSIGKLSCIYPRYKAIKDRYKYINKIKNDYNNKEDKATI